MLIFGEKINTVNKAVKQALEKKDKDFFRELVLAQIDSGITDVIDVNIGSDSSIEPANMQWAVKVAEEATGGKTPLSIDSSSPETIIAGLNTMNNKKGSYINSITLEEKRYKELLPLAKEYDLNIIALPIDGTGIPESTDGRVRLAHKLAELVSGFNISLDKLYIDCIINPVSISRENGILSLETVNRVKKEIPGSRTIICLSAVSFGLPQRRLINKTFLPLLLKEDIDALILDPLDDELIAGLYAANMLLGKDPNCLKFLKYIKGRNKKN